MKRYLNIVAVWFTRFFVYRHLFFNAAFVVSLTCTVSFSWQQWRFFAGRKKFLTTQDMVARAAAERAISRIQLRRQQTGSRLSFLNHPPTLRYTAAAAVYLTNPDEPAASTNIRRTDGLPKAQQLNGASQQKIQGVMKLVKKDFSKNSGSRPIVCQPVYIPLAGPG